MAKRRSDDGEFGRACFVRVRWEHPPIGPWHGDRETRSAAKAAIDTGAAMMWRRFLKLPVWLTLPLAVAACLLAARFLYSSRADREVARAIARIRERGEPVTPAELVEFARLDDVNEELSSRLTSVLLHLGKARLKTPGAVGVDVLNDLAMWSKKTPLPSPIVSELMLAAIRVGIASHQPALDELHALTRLRGSVQFPNDWPNLHEMLIPHMDGAGCANNLLLHEIVLAVNEHDRKRAEGAIVTRVRLGNLVSSEPYSVAQLTRIREFSESIDQLVSSLGHVDFDEIQLTRLDGEIAACDFREPLRRALLGDRVAVINRAFQPAPFDWSLNRNTFNLRTDRKLALNICLRRFDDFHQSPLGTWAEIKQAGTAYHDGLERDLSLLLKERPWFDEDEFWPPALSAPLLATIGVEVRRDACRVMIAIERYRRENGELPSSLEALVPEHLAVVPLDPIDGQPLRYQLAKDAVAVYSIGSEDAEVFDEYPSASGWSLRLALPNGTWRP